MLYHGMHYMGHKFWLMKDGMRNCGCAFTIAQGDVVMFVISLATMTSDAITKVLNANGIDMTMHGVPDTKFRLGIARVRAESIWTAARNTSNST